MQSGAISDGQITASSADIGGNIDKPPWDGRLHNSGIWVTNNMNSNEWLQIDLLSYYVIVARVATQGRGGWQQYVTFYNLQHSDDGVNFQYYREGKTIPKVRKIYIQILDCLNIFTVYFLVGFQGPTPRPRRGGWKQVSRGLLCRAKYGGGLLPPSHYGSHEGLLRTPKMPDQRGSGETRRANHPSSGYKEITETIGDTYKVTSARKERMSPRGLA